MKFNYSKRILILSLIFFTGVIILDVIFTNLLVDKIVKINNKVKQLNISSQEREKEIKLKDLIIDSKADREKLTEYFVGAGNAETLEFTKYLEDLALKEGVTEKKTIIEEPIVGLPSADTISAIRFRFNVIGKWANIYNFLQAIENLPKVVYLNSVSVSLNSGAVSAKEIKAGTKTWSADLDFSVIKLKD